MRTSRISTGLIAFLLATAAWAVTPAAVQDSADELLGQHRALGAAVAACVDGACEQADALRARFGQLSSEVGQLAGDREALEPCATCLALDQTIERVHDVSEAIAGRIGNWNEQT